MTESWAPDEQADDMTADETSEPAISWGETATEPTSWGTDTDAETTTSWGTDEDAQTTS